MDSCLFCKIVAGQIPSFKVYEDDSYLSFMDINPVSKGHVLVIPKRHYVNLFDLDPALASGYLAVVQKVAQRVCARLGAADFNLVMANGKNAQQSVDHAHIHIVPRWEKDGIDLFFHGRTKPGMEELAALHKTLL
jgi:histidine triad (HIT) family protein